MRKTRFVVATGLALFGVMPFDACGQEAPAPVEPAKVAPEKPTEVAHDDPASVLHAFVSAWGAERGDKAPRAFLFHATTRTRRYDEKHREKSRKYLLEKLEGLRSDTLEDYWKGNSAALDLRAILEPPPTLHFVTDEEYEEAFALTHGSSEWDMALRELLRSYPGARDLRSLSAPGVSSDGSQALVYATWTMGAGLRTGQYYLLEWEEGRWRLVDEALVWVS